MTRECKIWSVLDKTLFSSIEQKQIESQYDSFMNQAKTLVSR